MICEQISKQSDLRRQEKHLLTNTKQREFIELANVYITAIRAKKGSYSFVLTTEKFGKQLNCKKSPIWTHFVMVSWKC